MKWLRSILLCALMALTACGTADPSGLASDATQLPPAAPTAAAPSPAEAPSTSAEAASARATAVASPSPFPTSISPASTPTALPPLPPGWQTVEWEGLIIPVPPDFTWKPIRTEEWRLYYDMPVLAAGVVAPNLPAEIVIERPSGPGFYILQFKGSLEDWPAEEIRAVNALPAVTPTTTLWARDTTIAGRPAKAYPPPVGALGPGYEVYALKLDSQRLLLIRTEDTENATYRRVIDGLVITEGAVQATPTPANDGQLPPGWQSVEWQRLMIPVPPTSVWATPALDREQLNGIAIATSGTLTYPTSTAPVERPFGPSFTILVFDGSLDDWLNRERQNETSKAGNTVQEQTIREVMIAGRQAKAYQRAVIGTGQIEYYVLKLNNDKLLFITSDDAENETYRRVIDGLMIKQQ